MLPPWGSDLPQGFVSWEPSTRSHCVPQGIESAALASVHMSRYASPTFLSSSRLEPLVSRQWGPGFGLDQLESGGGIEKASRWWRRWCRSARLIWYLRRRAGSASRAPYGFETRRGDQHGVAGARNGVGRGAVQVELERVLRTPFLTSTTLLLLLIREVVCQLQPIQFTSNLRCR